MLQLTKRTEYGLIALVHLVDQEGVFVSAREIGEGQNLPQRLLAEVMKDLCRAGMVESQRGPAGGYRLAAPASEISLGSVVSSLEGPPRLSSCESFPAAAGSVCQREATCPIKSPLHRIREGIWNLFESTTLRVLVDSPHTLALGPVGAPSDA